MPVDLMSYHGAEESSTSPLLSPLSTSCLEHYNSGLMEIPSSSQPGSEEALTTVSYAVIANWMKAAAAAVAVYEWLITSDMEVRLMWCNNTSWKPKISTKLLYFVNRYGVVVDLILTMLHSSPTNLKVEFCSVMIYTVGATTILGSVLSEYILILRVCVAWKMNKIVIVFLATSCIGVIAYALTYYYLGLRSVKIYTLPPLGGCFVDTHGGSVWTTYMIILLYDTAMVTLMGYPTIKEYRSTYGKTELMRRVYDEGVIFYVFLVLIDITSVALQLSNIVDAFPVPSRILRSMLAARTVLHMRDYVSREATIGSTTKSMSNIRFKSWDESGSEVEV